MYYEEKIIDGVLHCRVSPDGAWRPRDATCLTSMLVEDRAELARLRAENERLREALQAIVDCWDGPKYAHTMAPLVIKARAALNPTEEASQ